MQVAVDTARCFDFPVRLVQPAVLILPPPKAPVTPADTGNHERTDPEGARSHNDREPGAIEIERQFIDSVDLRRAVVLCRNNLDARTRPARRRDLERLRPHSLGAPHARELDGYRRAEIVTYQEMNIDH
ncbi:hypothetical protein ABCS02_28560 [Microbacterium sp. X-17]|uniref:hypothetical protein n=1 Tax=Microbacterium sp. X-17 TaxID=3144404 RepID=UPI0031F4C0DA